MLWPEAKNARPCRTT